LIFFFSYFFDTELFVYYLEEEKDNYQLIL